MARKEIRMMFRFLAWATDKLYSEIGNKEIEQINRGDDKFRLNMPSLR